MYQEVEMVEAFKGLTKNIISFFENNLFKKLGISCSEWNVIKTVNENKEMNVTELSQTLKMSKSAVSQLVSKLERKNLIKRKLNLFDKKMCLIILTDEGNEIYKKQNLSYLEAIEKVSMEMGNEDRKELSRLLDKLSNIIDKLGGEK